MKRHPHHHPTREVSDPSNTVTIVTKATPPTTPAPGQPGGRCTRRPGYATTGCRCSDSCRKANTAARAARKRLEDAGFAGRVPARPVQAHLRRLLEANPTLTIADLAAASGVARRSIGLILDADPDRTVNRSTAIKITRLVPKRVTPVPNLHAAAAGAGIVTRRKIEALMAQGWPLTTLARLAGCSDTTLSFANLHTGCSRDTATRVDQLFQRLKLTPGPSAWTAARAASLGCLPWAAWDDLNNPHTHPDLDGLPRALRRAWRNRRRQPVTAPDAAAA